MSLNNDSVKNLVLLVGSNPLLNYIAVKILQPDKIYFVYSEQTKDPKKRLESLLGEEGFILQQSVPIFVDDAAGAQSIYPTYKT